MSAPPFRAARQDAFETLGHATPGRVLYTCEHASNRVPTPWRPRAHDRILLSWHWGYDIGAAAVTRELVRLGRGAGVLSRFSRLLVDPNRAPDDPTAILAATTDGDLTFNRHLTPERALARVERFHLPFHAAIDGAVQAVRPRWIVSIHSFTPWYRGQRRTLDAGVLFDRYDDVALALVEAMRAQGLVTEANEPYSGKAGLIYSANRHGTRHDVPYVELELRQDLIAAERSARRVAQRVFHALTAVGVEAP